MRYVTDQEELIVMCIVAIDNSARAAVSYRGPTGHRQWKFSLVMAPKDEAQTLDHDNFLAWILSLPVPDIDMFAESLHEQATESFRLHCNKQLPFQVLDLRSDPTAKKAERVEAEKDNFAISMRDKSSEEKGYCIIVFDVTRDNGKVDRYSACIIVGFLYRNILLLYRRGLFGKFMKMLTREFKNGGELSHVTTLSKVDMHKDQAVCVSLPETDGIVDMQFKTGCVYTIVDFNSAMNGSQYITVRLGTTDVDRDTKHFIVYRRLHV